MDFVFGLILTGLLLTCVIILMCINSWIKDLSNDLATIRRLLSTKEYDVSSLHPDCIMTTEEFGGNYTETFKKELSNIKDRYAIDYKYNAETMNKFYDDLKEMNLKIERLEKKMNEIYIEE